MKMMSSTSMTSTSGTTLISASDVRDARPAALTARGIVTDGLNLGHYVKFRSTMFRNSSEKSSISEARIFTR